MLSKFRARFDHYPKENDMLMAIYLLIRYRVVRVPPGGTAPDALFYGRFRPLRPPRWNRTLID